jgi:hypothetical protein
VFLKTFDQMGLFRSVLCSSRAPFHRIVPGVVATLIGQIALPVTFKTWENFHTKYKQFEVANFEMAYNVFLGQLELTKFDCNSSLCLHGIKDAVGAHKMPISCANISSKCMK